MITVSRVALGKNCVQYVYRSDGGLKFVKPIRRMTDRTVEMFDTRFSVFDPGALRMWFELYNKSKQATFVVLISACIEAEHAHDNFGFGYVSTIGPDALTELLKCPGGCYYGRATSWSEGSGIEGLILWYSHDRAWPQDQRLNYSIEQARKREQLLELGLIKRIKYTVN